MAKIDPQVLAHLEWLGFVRPTGLVVSAPALVRAGAILNQHDIEGQRTLRASVGAPSNESVRERPATPYTTAASQDVRIQDFCAFATAVLGWQFSPKGYAGTDESPIPSELEVTLPDFGETLRPHYSVRELDPLPGAPQWQLLVTILSPGEQFEEETRHAGRLGMSAHSRMERLLREAKVPAGLLVSDRGLRLVSAPRGESSGWIDFQVADMVKSAGRPICTAMRLLLSEQRLLALPRHQRLAALLADSRRFQNEVSEKLAKQVLHALYELLRGFQAAHDASGRELLGEVLAKHPDEVYRALLTVILRLVFLLYVEEREMLPGDTLFQRYYSIAGLYDRLREDAALNPDTLDQRFGAWAQLISLFRLIHGGADAPGMSLPARHGVLFDPSRFPFLEGQPLEGAAPAHARIQPPLVPDGTIYRALENLLVLDGERISYRALDVEQIGSVYETMMGFRLESATGRSLAIRAPKPQGAPTTVDLETLLTETGTARAKWLQDRTDRKVTDKIKKELSAASTLADLHAALLPVVDQAATPDLVPRGAMVLQPSEERRRSGSHYTPRELTEPIVRTTLDPVLAQRRSADGKPPRPEDVLDLKVCDPAMGSGAFLVETCRYLADALIDSWKAHDVRPAIPSDEDEVVFARRLVAQRCLYGVDRNSVAVDLAKMSLWLATLAKDHALTFVDHALRHGDSLIGLSRQQIEAFHWEAGAPYFQAGFEAVRAREHLARVATLRRAIREAAESIQDWQLRAIWDEAQIELGKVRLLGDLAVAAYFDAESSKYREAKRREFANAVLRGDTERHLSRFAERRDADPPFAPFHWEIEFPEVFERANSGFDAVVGNPPFMRGKAIGTVLGTSYRDYLTDTTTETNASADIVAFFFRRAFAMLRPNGAFGLIATKTISKGDTRRAGLRYICNNGGVIFSARKRLKWPGSAAVVVSTLHVSKGAHAGARLDGASVPRITAFLFSRGGNDDPVPLSANANLSFNGCALAGVGFTFDDLEPRASSLLRLRELISADPTVSERVFPFLGGDEINSSPTHAHRRLVIFFNGMSLAEASRWPTLLEVVRERVKPERDQANRRQHRERWWRFGDWRPGLFGAIADKDRMLCVVFVSQHLGFAWIPTDRIVSHNVGVFACDKDQFFCVLQSRVHELFATQLSSGLEDRPGYRPSDGFEPFPFPSGWETAPLLATAGKSYYDFRATLMVRNNEGLTKTYNRFHDPEEHDAAIVRLRELHTEMDRVVLDAYGWHDLAPSCEFLLDYEIDEEDWGDKKKPYRYRWNDDVQAELLARLLELNAERTHAEARAGSTGSSKKVSKGRQTRAKEASLTKDLFS